MSSQDPPGSAQLEVLAVTELGVAMFRILYEVSWEDMEKTCTPERVLMAPQRNSALKSLSEPSGLFGDLMEHPSIGGDS